MERNIDKLRRPKFFTDHNSRYFGTLHIFVVNNGADFPVVNGEFLHIFHNRNSGGSGGFQRGLEEIRAFPVDFTHVIFMDDDVAFELDAFYLLYDFLANVEGTYMDHPVAGRMFCKDRPDIQKKSNRYKNAFFGDWFNINSKSATA